jgi:3-methyladenine DNA glycosylase AlkD
MAELKKKGSAQTQKTYARHGMAIENTFGVSIADLKGIAKTIRGKQTLACELYETGKMEAMYLAALVADGRQMTAKRSDQWAERACDSHDCRIHGALADG